MSKIDPKLEAEFIQLLLPVKKKLFHGKVSTFGVQKFFKGSGKFMYDWPKRGPINQDFIDHFLKDGIDRGNYIEGALMFVPLQQEGIITQIIIDCDDKERREFVLKEVAPKCDQLSMDYIIEHGGRIPFDRLHFRMFTKVKEELSRAFFRQFFGELGEPILSGSDEKYFNKKIRFDEVYGANQVNRACRFIYGFHIKPERNRRYPCEYRGDDLDDPISVLKALIDMKPITEDFMKSYLKDDFFPASVVKPNIEYKSEIFKFNSLDLPLYVDYLPEQIKPVLQNCQALNEMMKDAIDDGLIYDPGQKHHDSGFALAGVFRYVNVKYKTEEGREAWNRFKADYRIRDDKGHNWWHGEDKEPYYYIWTCDKYEKYFGRCEGCPFRGRVKSPRDFVRGIKIKRTITPAKQKLVKIEDIRNNTFKDVQELIINSVKINDQLKEMTE